MTLAGLSSSARTAAASEPLATPGLRPPGKRTVVPRAKRNFSASPVLSDVLDRVIDLRAGDAVIDLVEAEAGFIGSSTVGILSRARHPLVTAAESCSSPSTLADKLLDPFGRSELVEVREQAHREASTDDTDAPTTPNS
jgi:hypothetical protein